MGEVRSLSDVLAEAELSLASPEEVTAWEREHAEHQRSESLRLSGIMDVLSQSGADPVVRDRCAETAALALVRSWLASRRPVLALFGGRGLGKTVAAAWALARVPGRYVEASALAASSTADFGAPSGDYHRALRCGLLVVDELGIEANKDLAVATIHDVVNRRQKLPRRTLLLGNMGKQQFLDRYDTRTIDRLREIAVLRRVSGESMRKGAL